jgi:predicted kinase
MRRRAIIPGLKNSQRVRVIVNGVGFYTTVQGATEMVFTEQRVAVWNALEVIARENIRGYGGQTRAYDYKMIAKTIDFQVNLL